MAEVLADLGRNRRNGLPLRCVFGDKWHTFQRYTVPMSRVAEHEGIAEDDRGEAKAIIKRYRYATADAR